MEPTVTFLDSVDFSKCSECSLFEQLARTELYPFASFSLVSELLHGDKFDAAIDGDNWDLDSSYCQSHQSSGIVFGNK